MTSERNRAGHAVVLYDADCGFCRWSVATLLRWDARTRLRPVAIQTGAGQDLLAAVPRADRLGSAHTVDPDGRLHSGGAWLAAALTEVPGGRAPATMLRALHAPVDAVYALVARQRSTVSRLVTAAAKDGAQARIDRHAARFTVEDPARSDARREAEAHAAA